MKKKHIYLAICIMAYAAIQAQPTFTLVPRTLPYSQNFGTSHIPKVNNPLEGFQFIRINSSYPGNKTENSITSAGNYADGAFQDILQIQSSITGTINTNYASEGEIISFNDASDTKLALGFGSRNTGFVLGLNTVGFQNIKYAFSYHLIEKTSTTISGGIFMQYKVGSSGTWNTISATEYTLNSGSTKGEMRTISGILPAPANNQSTVYIRFTTYQNPSSFAPQRMVVGIDNISFAGDAFAISNLGIRSLSSTVQETQLFTIVVSSENVFGNIGNVSTPTAFRLVASGTGTLSGTSVGTFTGSVSSITFTGLSYKPWQTSPITIKAVSVSGLALQESATINMNVTSFVGPTKLKVSRIIAQQKEGFLPNSNFTVVVQAINSLGSVVEVTQNISIRLAVSKGLNELSGAITSNFPQGFSTITLTGVQYRTVEKGLQLRAELNGSQPLSLSPSDPSEPIDVGKLASKMVFEWAKPLGNIYQNRTIGFGIVFLNDSNEVSTIQNTGTLTATVFSGNGKLLGTPKLHTSKFGDQRARVIYDGYDKVEDGARFLLTYKGTQNFTVLSPPISIRPIPFAQRTILFKEDFERNVDKPSFSYGIPATIRTHKVDNLNANPTFLPEYKNNGWLLRRISEAGARVNDSLLYIDNSTSAAYDSNYVMILATWTEDNSKPVDSWIIINPISLTGGDLKINFQAVGLNLFGNKTITRERIKLYYSKGEPQSAFTRSDWYTMRFNEKDTILEINNEAKNIEVNVPRELLGKRVGFAVQAITYPNQGDRLVLDNFVIHSDPTVPEGPLPGADEWPAKVTHVSTAMHPSLQMYPNPTDGKVIFQPSVEGKAYVYDLHGRLVMEASLDGANTALDVSTLVPGWYNVMVRTPQYTQVNKLIRK